MLLGFLYLRMSNYQLSSSNCDYNFCNMFLCTYPYKISKFVLRTYTLFYQSGDKSKNDRA